MIIPFSEWTPDLPEFMNLGGITVTNVIPQIGGYAPWKSLVTSTGALNSQCFGAFSVKNLTGDEETFAGTATKLYRLTGSVWNDVTNSGGAYSIGSDGRWEYAQYGTRIIAVTLAENPQSYVIGTSSNFADLGGTPPNASTVGVIRDFVVIGGISTQRNRVQWSDIDDPTEWSTGQSGSQDIPEGGAVIKIIGGDVGYVFQEAAISRMTYVGPDLIFDFDSVIKNIGIQAPGGVVRVGDVIFFMATDGFYQMHVADGSMKAIGHGKVDKTTLSDIDPASLHLVSTAYDTNLKIVVWAYPSLNNTGTADRIAVYHYPSGSWSLIEVSVDVLFSHLTEGVTLEGLDSLYDDMDTAGMPSLDASIFKGGERVLAAINTSQAMGTFEGENLLATIETGEFEGIQGMRSYVNNVRPLIDANTITGVIRSRERLADSVSDSVSGSLNSAGYVPIDSLSGRYHRVKLTVPAETTWSFAQAVELEPVKAGRY